MQFQDDSKGNEMIDLKKIIEVRELKPSDPHTIHIETSIKFAIHSIISDYVLSSNYSDDIIDHTKKYARSQLLHQLNKSLYGDLANQLYQLKMDVFRQMQISDPSILDRFEEIINFVEGRSNDNS